MTKYQLTGQGYVIKNDIITVPTVGMPGEPITNPDYLEYAAWLAAGNVPLPVDAGSPTLAETRKRAFDEVREMRAPMLNAVTGIMVNALADNDAPVVEEAQVIRQKLLDITADAALNAATTYDDMKVAGQLAYRRIAKAASRSFAVVFKEITGA